MQNMSLAEILLNFTLGNLESNCCSALTEFFYQINPSNLTDILNYQIWLSLMAFSVYSLFGMLFYRCIPYCHQINPENKDIFIFRASSITSNVTENKHGFVDATSNSLSPSVSIIFADPSIHAHDDASFAAIFGTCD